MRKILAAIGLTVVMTLGVVACSNSKPTYYRPFTFGEGGHCYYLQDPAEVIALQRAGYCQSSWSPMLMPTYWHMRYAGYYDSPAYYGEYVPASERNIYIARATAFEKANTGKIQFAQKTATWTATKGSKTFIVSGDKVDYSRAGFKSGNVRSGGFSSGFRCPGVLNPPFLLGYAGGGYSGGGSRSGGGGFSGGGSRSGGGSSGGVKSGGGSRSGGGYSGGSKSGSSYGKNGSGRIGGAPNKSSRSGIC